MLNDHHNNIAPLASVEDLSRINTPGGSPSPRTKMKHPALTDPNWEPPEDYDFVKSARKDLELTPLHPQSRLSPVNGRGVLKPVPSDR